jgi:hypothetical protein
VEDFFRLAMEFAFGFFGSLIINPRRKCDFPHDHYKRLKSLSAGKKSTFPLEAEARKVALGVLRDRPFRKLDLKTVMNQKSLAPAAFMGARFLGEILGKRLHQAVLAETLEIRTIRELFLVPVSAASHEERFRILFDTISLTPVSPSKTAHL